MATILHSIELQNHINEMFMDFRSRARDILVSSVTFGNASERILSMVNSKIAAASDGYLEDIYSILTEQIKQDDFFQDPEHLSAFYKLNLREKLHDKYRLDVKAQDICKNGIVFKEVNKLHMSIASVAGTLVLGGIVKFAFSDFPFVVAILASVAIACAAYFKVIPLKNSQDFQEAVNQFLSDLENALLKWLAEIEEFFNSEVKTITNF